MGTQLRVSVFIDHPAEPQVHDEIPRVVESAGGVVTLQAGDACVTFSDREALIALLAAAG